MSSSTSNPNYYTDDVTGDLMVLNTFLTPPAFENCGFVGQVITPVRSGVLIADNSTVTNGQGIDMIDVAWHSTVPNALSVKFDLSRVFHNGLAYRNLEKETDTLTLEHYYNEYVLNFAFTMP